MNLSPLSYNCFLKALAVDYSFWLKLLFLFLFEIWGMRLNGMFLFNGDLHESDLKERFLLLFEFALKFMGVLNCAKCNSILLGLQLLVCTCSSRSFLAYSFFNWVFLCRHSSYLNWSFIYISSNSFILSTRSFRSLPIFRKLFVAFESLFLKIIFSFLSSTLESSAILIPSSCDLNCFTNWVSFSLVWVYMEYVLCFSFSSFLILLCNCWFSTMNSWFVMMAFWYLVIIEL